jgi:hypothetical protein
MIVRIDMLDLPITILCFAEDPRRQAVYWDGKQVFTNN